MQKEEIIFDRMQKRSRVIIYGAHLVAKEVYRYLQKHRPDLKIETFAVTNLEGNPDFLEGITVRRIFDIASQPVPYILIAMPEKYHEEAARTLESLGFDEFEKIGLKKISLLKGTDMVWDLNRSSRKYFFEQSLNDYSWLDLFEKDRAGKKIEGRHYKFTILSRLSEQGTLKKLEGLDFKADYEKILGMYRNLGQLEMAENKSADRTEGCVDVYMVSCQNDKPLETTYQPCRYVHPLQAGAALTNVRKAELTDNHGENISDKNVSFAEMTAMYWIWKNAPSAKYKGLCHYRRHFIMSEKQAQELERQGIDVVLTTPRLVLSGLKKMFLSDTPVKKDVFENMMNSIEETVGNVYSDYAEKYFDSIFYYPNNMLIAKEEVFHAYCRWIFPILFCMEQHDLESHVMKKDRHLAFAAELLTSLYFSFHKDDYKIGVTDYLFLE